MIYVEISPTESISISNENSDKTLTRKQMKAKVKLFNKDLVKYALNKQLKKAVKEFSFYKNNKFPLDIHSYTNLMNIHIRCLDIDGAQKIYDTILLELRNNINEVTITTLLKGYCEVGDMNRAYEILVKEYQKFGCKPNFRSVSTFMRGCKKMGNVMLATSIFDKFKNIVVFCSSDFSSLEYYFSLLSQSLQVEMMEKILLETNVVNLHCSLELFIVNVLIGDHFDQKVLDLSQQLSNEFISNDPRVTVGSNSTKLFTRHKYSEMELEFNQLKQYFILYRDAFPDSKMNQMLRMYTYIDSLSRFFLLGGIPLESSRDEYVEYIINTLFSHYGLSILLHMIPQAQMDLLLKALILKLRKSLHKSQCTFKFSSIFQCFNYESLEYEPSIPSNDKEIYLELGSGNGDWIVTQANYSRKHQPQVQWIGVELKYDRVYQILTKSILYRNNVQEMPYNLLYCGGDALEILSRNIPKCSISKIMVNFPEPPERRSGIAQSQGSHMLTSAMLFHIHQVLREGSGQLCILSDNIIYLKSILMQILEDTLKYLRYKNKSMVYGFASKLLNTDNFYIEYMQNINEEYQLIIYKGFPDEAMGYYVDSSSYFDRLWNNGQLTGRWFLFVDKI